MVLRAAQEVRGNAHTHPTLVSRSMLTDTFQTDPINEGMPAFYMLAPSKYTSHPEQDEFMYRVSKVWLVWGL